MSRVVRVDVPGHAGRSSRWTARFCFFFGFSGVCHGCSVTGVSAGPRECFVFFFSCVCVVVWLDVGLASAHDAGLHVSCGLGFWQCSSFFRCLCCGTRVYERTHIRGMERGPDVDVYLFCMCRMRCRKMFKGGQFLWTM